MMVMDWSGAVASWSRTLEGFNIRKPMMEDDRQIFELVLASRRRRFREEFQSLPLARVKKDFY
jgi:hypothetical protein